MMALSMLKKLCSPRMLKLLIGFIAVVNIFYLSSVMLETRSPKLTNKLKTHVNAVWDKFGEYSDQSKSEAWKDDHEIPKTTTVATDTAGSKKKESPKPKLYDIPDKSYKDLTAKEKILYKLNEVSKNKKKYWLAHTELTDHQIKINVKEFMKESWKDKSTLYYDPRFTLSIYVNEIKNQYLRKNPENSKSKIHEIVVPFAWSDWVDLTMLNEELMKHEKDRKDCEYMKRIHHIPARDPNYCINNNDITEDDLKEMNLSSTSFVPGFAVKKSPANKASNEIRMWEGKSHLLTYAKNPLAMIFLSKDGVYEAKIDGKQRIVNSDLFESFLTTNGHTEDSIILDPVQEFNDLMEKVAPNPLEKEDDEYGMVAKIKEKDDTKSRELYLPQTAFNYQQDKVEKQIKEYDERLNALHKYATNELEFNPSKISELRLTRNEKIYYDGLKYASQFDIENEDTYFRMARLNFGNEENAVDAGWHYEWRFFNGALRYLKQGWNEDELLIREKVLLDRILRNWFRFANEKGIISWIAHGPLLSWYWDGLLFPFDEDIDIQMPAEELTRFSKLYNQTLIVEDLTEGFGKFFIDCSPFLHHRGKSHKENHIDARFIDIDTGSYIDITGLGISDEPAPEKYKDLIDKAAASEEPRPVYNCRNLHFYSYDELSPLKFTMMGGVPLYVPNRIQEVLKDEYSSGLTAYDYDGFYFVDAIDLWIHASKLEFLFEGKDYLNGEGNIDNVKFTELVKAIDDNMTLRLFERHEDILLEYYITKEVTELHKKELTFLFDMPHGENSKIADIGNQKSEHDISTNTEYHKLTSQFNFQKPFRRPLFNYENIDKPAHHKDH